MYLEVLTTVYVIGFRVDFLVPWLLGNLRVAIQLTNKTKLNDVEQI